MDRITITGGIPLSGSIPISGAKNAALPLMAVGLLSDQELVLENVPRLSDVLSMKALLEELGTEVSFEGNRMALRTVRIANGGVAPYDIVRKMRASFLVLGPLLARIGHARVSLPGGCTIGARPVGYHIDGLKALGASVTIEDGYVCATLPDTGARDCEYCFPRVSVTGTENLVLASALSDRTFCLRNAAQEPEVADLLTCLENRGVYVEGKGTSTLVIKGSPSLCALNHRVIPDRLELGTYIIAAGITGGEITLTGSDLSLLSSVVPLFQQAGIELSQPSPDVVVAKRNGPLHPLCFETAPYPGIPTDLQAQFMALMSVAQGRSAITETVFENRFLHVSELARMGAQIIIQGSTAIIEGQSSLIGAPVMATDLRASISLVLAALAAEGTTVIHRVYHLDRGYENVEEKLSSCGSSIHRLSSAA